MGNWVNMTVDVLACCPEELKKIEVKMKGQGGTGLWTSFAVGRSLDGRDHTGQAKRFWTTFKSASYDVVGARLFDISQKSMAIFLVEFADPMMRCIGKIVLCNGFEVRSTADLHQKAWGYEWAFLDIFAPFRAEYENRLKLGSLWDQWLQDMAEGLDELRSVGDRNLSDGTSDSDSGVSEVEFGDPSLMQGELPLAEEVDFMENFERHPVADMSWLDSAWLKRAID